MAHPTTIDLVVNGRARSVLVDPESPLLWVLRDHLGLTGAKYGCGAGMCGACTVHLAGKPIRSCVVTVERAASELIETIEGVAPDHPVLLAWAEVDVAQCGYCQPGQVMSALGLLSRDSEPDDRTIDAAMAGNLCRCGTYPRIRRAVRLAATLSRPPRN